MWCLGWETWDTISTSVPLYLNYILQLWINSVLLLSSNVSQDIICPLSLFLSFILSFFFFLYQPSLCACVYVCVFTEYLTMLFGSEASAEILQGYSWRSSSPQHRLINDWCNVINWEILTPLFLALEDAWLVQSNIAALYALSFQMTLHSSGMDSCEWGQLLKTRCLAMFGMQMCLFVLSVMFYMSS